MSDRPDHPQMPPTTIAAYDQELAKANQQLDILVRALHIGTAEVGEPQAMASLFAKLDTFPASHLSSLLLAAMHRLSQAEGKRP